MQFLGFDPGGEEKFGWAVLRASDGQLFFEAGGVCSVDIEFRATNQRGTVTAPAEATVLLPSRTHGSVKLPLVPEAVRQKATDMFARHCELGGMAPWANLAARDR